MSEQVFRFRGCDNLYIAEVTEDSIDAITYGSPIKLAPLAEVGKTTASDSGTEYGDNKPLIVINSEGPDEISLSVFGISLKNLSIILGKTFDEQKGMYIDNARETKYFALGYREKLTNGKFRYVWRFKGVFSIPDEGAATENDGVESTGQEVSYTGIMTTHEFTNGGSAKGIIVDTQYEGANVTDFFTAVVTPDTQTA